MRRDKDRKREKDREREREKDREGIKRDRERWEICTARERIGVTVEHG